MVAAGESSSSYQLRCTDCRFYLASTGMRRYSLVLVKKKYNERVNFATLNFHTGTLMSYFM
jgi:hypothetical protein